MIPVPKSAPRWKRFILSGWTSLIGLMGAAVAIEYYTRPWKSPVIPTPYTMFYALATFVCAQHGYAWGIAASMLWFTITSLMGHFYWNQEVKPTPLEYVIRGALQLGVPILLSRPVEKLRKILLIIATAVNHEFNNMLQVIIGHLCLLRDSVPEKEQHHIDAIQKAAERMAGVVRGMRHYAALGKVSPEMVDISEMARAIKPPNGNGGNGKMLNI